METELPDPRAAMERAIKLAGSEKKLGDAAGYSQNAIWAAKRKGKVSAEMAAAIERATNRLVTKTDLRPDLFPPLSDVQLETMRQGIG